MRYTDLDVNLKNRLNGSINLLLVDFVTYKNYKNVQSDSFFNEWLVLRTILKDDTRFYRWKTDLWSDYFYESLDEELISDIKLEIEKRVHKRKKIIEYKIAEQYKGKPTDRQIIYANELYKLVYGKKGIYDSLNYSKYEMNNVISELKNKSIKKK